MAAENVALLSQEYLLKYIQIEIFILNCHISQYLFTVFLHLHLCI